MIGITISGQAYAAIAPILAGSAVEGRLARDAEYRLWLPWTVVNRLRSLRDPGETFSDIILRLVERGSFATLTR
jgi:hypothetical protein